MSPKNIFTITSRKHKTETNIEQKSKYFQENNSEELPIKRESSSSSPIILKKSKINLNDDKKNELFSKYFTSTTGMSKKSKGHEGKSKILFTYRPWTEILPLYKSALQIKYDARVNFFSVDRELAAIFYAAAKNSIVNIDSGYIIFDFTAVLTQFNDYFNTQSANNINYPVNKILNNVYLEFFILGIIDLSNEKNIFANRPYSKHIPTEDTLGQIIKDATMEFINILQKKLNKNSISHFPMKFNFISDFWALKERLVVESKSGGKSGIFFLENKKERDRIVQYNLRDIINKFIENNKVKKNFNPFNEVLRACSQRNKIVRNWHISAMIEIINHIIKLESEDGENLSIEQVFEKFFRRVLDPCGGWGDRLIALLIINCLMLENRGSNQGFLVINDVNEKLIPKYKEIVNYFAEKFNTLELINKSDESAGYDPSLMCT